MQETSVNDSRGCLWAMNDDLGELHKDITETLQKHSYSYVKLEVLDNSGCNMGLNDIYRYVESKGANGS